MLYDRIVDNKEIARTIWKICAAFNNDLYSVKRFALRWMICTALSGMYCVEWLVLRGMIWTTLYNLYSVELFVQRWIICSTALNYLCDLEWFVQHWLICTSLNDSECDGWFLQRWIIWATMNYWVSALTSARCAYSKKYCKIFCTNLWVDFFLVWKYQEEKCSALPQKLVIKRCFWSLLWKLL